MPSSANKVLRGRRGRAKGSSSDSQSQWGVSTLYLFQIVGSPGQIVRATDPLHPSWCHYEGINTFPKASEWVIVLFKFTRIHVPDPIIWQGLVTELLSNCDGQLKTEVAHMAAYYEHRLQLGSKAIYHLEAFTAKFMAVYKKFMEDGLDAMMFWPWPDSEIQLFFFFALARYFHLKRCCKDEICFSENLCQNKSDAANT